MKEKNIKLSEIPEEVTEDGLKIYGPASYETQVAILSHYLHTLDGKHDIASCEKRYEILSAIHDYIEYKKQKDKSKDWQDVDEEEIASMVAEGSPLQYDLFSDFFNVHFPAPESPKFTFIDLFAGMGGFRLAMQAQGGSAYSLLNGMPTHRKHIFQTLATCPLVSSVNFFKFLMNKELSFKYSS